MEEEIEAASGRRLNNDDLRLLREAEREVDVQHAIVKRLRGRIAMEEVGLKAPLKRVEVVESPSVEEPQNIIRPLQRNKAVYPSR